MQSILKLRPLAESDIGFIADYWLLSDKDYLTGMGVDLKKIPAREVFVQMLLSQIRLPDPEKSSLAFIADIDGNPSGHCNVNNITFGKEAAMHLHLWKAGSRKTGFGTRMVNEALPLFFDRLKLDTIWCEPYSENPAPNKTLEKAGFEFVRKYRTIPGSLNFEQEVNQWRMTRERFESLKKF